MIWVILGLLTAFFESLKDVFSKNSLKRIDEYVMSWSLCVVSSVVLLPAFLFVGVPALGGNFWLALVGGGLLNTIAILLYMRAIKLSDLSTTIPLLTFTPVFLLLTSPLILGEFPSALGLAGVLLIFFGSYMLNIKHKKQGVLAPFKALVKEKGPRLMLLVALIWSVTSNIDKIGMQASSPLFWAMATNAFIVVVLLPVMLFKSRGCVRQMADNYRFLIPAGVLAALAFVCQMTALKLTLVAYVISLKRTSAILSVLFGHFIFKEKGIKERLVGAVIMVAGVVLIALS